MAKGKNTRPNGVDREAHQEAVPAADLSKEPTIQDWHALLNAILEHEDEIQLTVQFLLLGSPSGRAFLEYITEYRPKIVDGPIFDFLELVTTYETLGLLEVLKAEPRFGVDPEFFIWREFWDDSSRGPYAPRPLGKARCLARRQTGSGRRLGRADPHAPSLQRYFTGRVKAKSATTAFCALDQFWRQDAV